MGRSPCKTHLDCSYLVSMAQILRPVADENGDLSIIEAFETMAGSELPCARKVAEALETL